MNPHSALDSLTSAERVDAECDRFERDWLAGTSPRIELFLAAGPEAERRELLRALLLVELELRSQAGHKPLIDEYLGRFPQETNLVREGFVEFAASTPARSPASGHTVSLASPAADTSVPSSAAQTPTQPLEKLGRFQILEVLGEGAFGTVYRARDPDLDRLVAIKVPREGVLRTADDRQRFRREARAAANLSHPNICPVHEVGEADGHDYIVMGYLEGKPLSKLIASGKAQPRQAAAVVRKLAAALEEAHRKTIVHRDLKPANIMINRRGEPVVMDFGLARLQTPGDAQLTQSGVILGTPAYMSPEQARGDTASVGPASDIYSLGVILYELLAGRRPFEGSVTEVIGQILHVEPEPPSRHREIDARLEAICLKAMARTPADRYGSMRELAQALGDYLKVSAPAASAAALATTDANTSPVQTATDPAATQHVAALFDQVSAGLQSHAQELGRRQTRLLRLVAAGFALTVLAVLGGIWFFARTDTVTVVIQIPIDTKDPALSFFLDQQPLPAEKLAAPIELKPGEHELVVQRDGQLFKRFLFNVGKQANQPIVVQDMTPKPADTVGQIAGPDGAAFVPLFARGDLSDWQGQMDFWKLSDGTLAGRPGPSHNTFLFSRRPYADFELKFEVRVGVDNNSGVQIRSEVADRTQWTARGPQCDLGSRPGDLWGGLYGELLQGWMLKPEQPLRIKPNDFNDYFIRCVGKRVTIRVNGMTTVDGEVPQMADQGLIALQIHRGNVGEVTFRNAMIRELSRTPAPIPDEAGFIPDRKAAEWVLSVGGRVRVSVAEQVSPWILPGGVLPAGPLQLHSVFTVDEGARWQETDLQVLSGLTGLRSINFEQPFPHGDATMQVLKTLTGLEHLRFEDSNEISDAGLEHLAPLVNLKSLTLVSPRMTDRTLEAVARLPSLQALDLGITGYDSSAGFSAPLITARGLSHLKAAENLSRLNVYGVAVDAAGLQALGECRQIHDLKLGGRGVADAGLVHLAGMTQLVKLTLRRTGVTDAGLVHLKGLKDLETLDLEDSPVTGRGAQHLRELDKLSGLHMLGSPVDDAGLEQIKLLTKIRVLDVRGSKVTDAGVPHLVALAERLEVLHLIDTAITDAAAPHLIKLTKLRELTTAGSKMTPAGWRALKQGLPNCQLSPEP